MRMLHSILEHYTINRNIFIHYCRVAERVACTTAAILVIHLVCQLDFTTGYRPKMLPLHRTPSTKELDTVSTML